MLQKAPYLLYLLQFESFQNSIRMLMQKLSENRLAILAYSLGGIIVLILIFRFLARKK
jgi:hypothetical protein